MSYGQTFKDWRKAAGTSWHDYVNHAFVRGLGDGTLPRRAFLHYLKQDYVFLIHFARAWALAVNKAETVEEMRLAAGTVSALINEEMALHVETCAAVGISEQDLFATEERAENLAYTRYVLDSGHSGDLLDLLAALSPCVMGYGEIGRHLSHKQTSDEFSDWIHTYAAESYQQVCREVGELIDAAVKRRLGHHPLDCPRWPGLCHRFITATKLEAGFFQMGLLV